LKPQECFAGLDVKHETITDVKLESITHAGGKEEVSGKKK
jgi:hypothetical protein